MIHHLAFDSTIRFGSVEHYYHFLWGYLLPGLRAIQRLQSEVPDTVSHEFHFRTCGPVMDRILHETATLFGLDYRIVARDRVAPGARVIPVPRWDIDLARRAEGPGGSLSEGQNLPVQQSAVELIAEVEEVRKVLMNRAFASLAPGDAGRFRDKLIVLQRSNQPDFYRAGGPAEIPGYGTRRRTLVDLRKSVRLLQSEGLPVELFEPGSVTLAEQICAFADCKGIVGIFGAEFANIVWMRPGMLVMWIHRRITNFPWITRELCGHLQLRFVPVEIPDDIPPVLPLDLVRRYLA